MKNNRKSNKDVPDFAPGDLSNNTTNNWFASGSQYKISANRWFIVAMVMAFISATLAVTINILLPLKTIETVQVTKAEGGRIAVDSTPVGKWVPDNESIGYFISQWGANVFGINRSTLDVTLRDSADIVIDAAVDQLRELRRKDNPLVLLRDNPSYSRAYEFRTINFIKNDVALLRFKTITRKGDDVKVVYYAMTITFTLIKPNTMAKVMKNPAGMYVTNFNITEEVLAK